MASVITTSPVIVDATQAQTEPTPKRSLMPHKLLEAAIDGNEADLKQLLGLNDHRPPHTGIPTGEMTPIEPSDCLIKSVAGMENTILHILSANDHVNLVSTICEKDSSLLKACNVRNETPFHHAARFGRIISILELIRCAKSAFRQDPNMLKALLRQKNCLGETALHEAARHGHRAVVSILIEEYLELAGVVNDDSVSPLYLATARGSLDIVQNMVAKMLNHQITPSFYSGPKKQTALHAAVLQDPGLTKELLLLYSAPLDKWADETGRTPLHFVASTGNHEIAKLLLDKDPSLVYIPDTDSEKSFPVHTAARMGHVKMIVLLLQRCRDSGQLLDSNGRNFLHIAIEANKSNVIFKLLKDSKKEIPTLYWKKMLNKMANTMDNKGNTPLHLAAEHEYNDVMLSLLENNELDLTLQNKESLTALDLSVIQLRKSARNTRKGMVFGGWQRRDALGEFYIQKRGARFSAGWFQHYTKDQMSEAELIRSTNEDHISTTDTRGDKTNSQGLMAKAQLVGLGSVLISTVTFSAAFTLRGGINQDTGIPTLGREYMFYAFVLADFFAFIFSFIATIFLINSLRVHNSDKMERKINASMDFFTVAASFMFITLGLGLYLVLAPLGTIGTTILMYAFIAALMSSVFTFGLQFEDIRMQAKLLKHIPYAASDLKPINFWWSINKYPYLDNRQWFIYPFLAIFVAMIFRLAFMLAESDSVENKE